MTEPLFWKLHDLLRPYAIFGEEKRKRGATPNGRIPFSSRLSMAIRWFAGGDPLDILQVHGVSYQQVYLSVWIITDAINACKKIRMVFPTDYAKQFEIANGFKEISKVDFPSCLGCIDGMLVWMNKPNLRSTKEVGIGPKKFFCGRKKKFGINLQAICDHKRRFIDIDVRHPGSTSDYLCFTTSRIHQRILSDPNLIHPSLHFFGDSAYVNTPFMATPFKGTHSGVKDAYNYYHSQLRINIECAFGMLVHRWGVLRKPFPMNITVPKIIQVVKTLCILHNFCIDGREGDDISIPTAQDDLSVFDSGGFGTQDSSDAPLQHLDSPGHHSDDHDLRRLRREERAVTDLPRDRLLEQLQEMHITSRPAPFGSTTTNASRHN